MRINNALTTFQANKMTYKQAKTISDALTNSKSVDIICHDSSDKDTANSALLMWNYLYQRGIESRIILSQDLDMLHLRKNQSNIVQASSVNPDECADTLLLLDFSAIGKMHKNTVGYLNKASEVVCIDHHDRQDLFEDNDYIELSSELDENNLPEQTSLHYIDTTAKSATSVVYRFLEAMGEDITHDGAYDAMCGLVSDSVKKGILECDAKKGTITLSDKFINDKNAFEIYSKLYSKLSKDDIKNITKSIDIMASLAPEQQEFYNSLYDRIQYSKDKKIAYVVIPPDDEQWNELGGDNPVTSTMLNKFRRTVLKDNKNYPDTQYAVVFYPSDNMYRLSIHTKSENMRKFFSRAVFELESKHNEFSIGGHRSRGGGKIIPKSDSDCKKFIDDILDCLNSHIIDEDE